MRLIDADMFQDHAYQSRFDMAINERELALINYMLAKEPTIDPVKHEHWTRKRMLNHSLGTWKTLCMCSGCRHTQLTESAFCGGCGAKMDGDADE